MLFAPKPLGNRKLDPDVLAEDKRKCLKIGPCGIGREAIYLNSFYIDRHYYVTYTDVRRVYKRVAMSKGGFSGKGAFGSVAYLVVEFSNGMTKQCNFKFEQNVDEFLRVIEEEHPEIKTHSEAAEKKLREAEIAEKAKYLKELTPEAEESVHRLQDAQDYLEENPETFSSLSWAARQKRTLDGIRTPYKIFGFIVMIASVIAIAAGIVAALHHKGWALYSVLFGFAFVLTIAATGILPTLKRNKRTAQLDWDRALENMRQYLEGRDDFPVPPQYAHPIVLERMIRAIRMGRAVSVSEALDVVKNDLKALNSSVTVSQKEYDEVIVVKPMFLVMDYR